MAFSFAGVPLIDPAPLSPGLSPDSFEIPISCTTQDYTDIEAILALAGQTSKTVVLPKTGETSGKTHVQTTGTMGTLVLGGNTYTDCVIDGPIQIDEIAPGAWRYSMKFVRDTT